MSFLAYLEVENSPKKRFDSGMNSGDIIVIACAVVGAALGLCNTIMLFKNHRVRIRVRGCFAFASSKRTLLTGSVYLA